MPGKIELVLPGLFDLPLSELAPGLLADELPALNRILRLGSPRPNLAFSIDAILRQVLALETPAEESVRSLPLAQACAPRPERQSSRMLLFQAVHLRPDLHSAVIAPIPRDKKNFNDIDILIRDLGDLFKVDCDISVIGNGLFLMELKAFDAPLHYPHILSVLGKTANPFIEQSRQHLGWYKLLNEMQMFLHQHEVNQDREHRGLLPVNSLWFWGGGDLPEKIDNGLHWYCDDTVLVKFGASMGLTTAPLDDLENLDRSSSGAVIDLRLLELLKTGMASELDQLLLDIETRLLQPLLRALERDRKSLYLRAGHESDFEMAPSAALKFWRRPRTLATWSGGAEDS
jgi:hypothetical protein